MYVSTQKHTRIYNNTLRHGVTNLLPAAHGVVKRLHGRDEGGSQREAKGDKLRTLELRAARLQLNVCVCVCVCV
jgi:hypothetical protein